jgi:hypothetical protein
MDECDPVGAQNEDLPPRRRDELAAEAALADGKARASFGPWCSHHAAAAGPSTSTAARVGLQALAMCARGEAPRSAHAALEQSVRRLAPTTPSPQLS